MKRVGGLEVDENLGFQEREWTMERIGWVGLCLVVIAAAVGLFGHGPISWSSTSTEDGSLEVSYERFGRRGGTQKLSVQASAEAARDGVWELDVSQSYVDSIEIKAIEPTPSSVDMVDGAVRYTFSQADADAALRATFSLTPAGLWSTSGDIRMAGGQSITVRHFIFP